MQIDPDLAKEIIVVITVEEPECFVIKLNPPSDMSLIHLFIIFTLLYLSPGHVIALLISGYAEPFHGL